MTALAAPLTSILIVDDEPAVRDLMARWVTSLGLRAHTAANADEALATARTQRYDMAVIDVMMPGRDGLWLATELQRAHPQMAVVIATAYTDLLVADPAERVADCLVKPFHRDRFALAVDRSRQWRKDTLDDVHWHAVLSIELHDRASQLLLDLTEQAHGQNEGVVLAGLMRQRMPDVAAHGERVARFALAVARQLGMSDADQSAVEVAARFHDVGKLAVPGALIEKPTALTPGETAVVRQHADVGADLLEATCALGEAAAAVRASHEWFGGGGYSRGLSGEAIPIASRIIAVADAFDAMTQDRAYRTRFDSTDAMGELLRCCPAQFDPRIVAAFLAVLTTVEGSPGLIH